ncbi:hypothetical protein ACWOA0_03875 [Ignavigranum ruoffiae]
MDCDLLTLNEAVEADVDKDVLTEALEVELAIPLRLAEVETDCE